MPIYMMSLFCMPRRVSLRLEKYRRISSGWRALELEEASFSKEVYNLPKVKRGVVDKKIAIAQSPFG